MNKKLLIFTDQTYNLSSYNSSFSYNLSKVKYTVLLLVVMMSKTLTQELPCSITNPSGNVTVQHNGVVCITQNTTLNDLRIEGNATFKIDENVKLKIENNVINFKNKTIRFEIKGELYLRQQATFEANMEIDVSKYGKMISGEENSLGNISFNGNYTKILNRGTMMFSVINFTNENSINEIENTSIGFIDIRSSLNSRGQHTVKNFGTLSLGSTYNNTMHSYYYNCGILNARNGFNLSGGTVINTGIFNHENGQIDMAGTSIFENYGLLDSKGGINASSVSTLYNEGLINIKNLNPNGMRIKGTENDAKKGYIKVGNKINANGSKIGPNLDFAIMINNTFSSPQNENDLFTSSPVYLNAQDQIVSRSEANVSFYCLDCSPINTNGGICPIKESGLCKKSPTGGTPSSFANVGISTLEKQNDNWPYEIPNAALVLDSKEKGFVITRVQHVSQDPDYGDSISPDNVVEGMLLYDKQDNCTKLFNGGIWKCIQNKCD